MLATVGRPFISELGTDGRGGVVESEGGGFTHMDDDNCQATAARVRGFFPCISSEKTSDFRPTWHPNKGSMWENTTEQQTHTDMHPCISIFVGTFLNIYTQTYIYMMHARRCYVLYVWNKGAVSLLCLRAAHLTFWLGARQTRCGNFLRSTGLCLYESPSYNLSTRIWHSGQCFVLRHSFLPETISASLSRRGKQTSLLSPQPVQMSCYCLVRNKKPQSWGRIRHKRQGRRCLFPYTGIYWLAGAAWWIHEDIF